MKTKLNKTSFKSVFQPTEKSRFSNYSNQRLVERINSRFKSGQNDDDEVLELMKRRDEGKVNLKVGFDTYKIIGDSKWKPNLTKQKLLVKRCQSHQPNNS